MIDALRDDLARKVGSKWKDIFKLTISFADGSSARISAINAALKPYRPNYMHFWQLKTFWNEAKVGCIEELCFSRFLCRFVLFSYSRFKQTQKFCENM